MPTEVRGELLSELFRRGFGSAGSEGVRLLRAATRNKDKVLAKILGAVVLRFGSSEDWSEVWTWIRRRPKLGKDVFEELARHTVYLDDVRVELVPEKLLGEACWGLWKWFPPEEDPEFEGGHTVTPREALGEFRSRLWRELASRGTSEAVDALETLHGRIGKPTWFRSVIAAAKKEAVAGAWVPRSTRDVLSWEREIRAVECEPPEGGDYLCRVKLRLTASSQIRAQNHIFVDDQQRTVGDVPLLGLLRLILELKEGKGGWIRVGDLVEEGIFQEGGKYQAIGRLRKPFRDIPGLDPLKLVQMPGDKTIRLSIPPDLVEVDRRLLQHRDGRIRDLVRKALPES